MKNTFGSYYKVFIILFLRIKMKLIICKIKTKNRISMNKNFYNNKIYNNHNRLPINKDPIQLLLSNKNDYKI